MRTVGIDLSASVKKTGVAVLEGDGDSAEVTELSVGHHSDAELCDLIRRADKTGIDCPLGWPAPFVDYVNAHRDGGKDLKVEESRQDLYHRRTDIQVTQEVLGIRPLAVTADRIGATAMRCAGILSILSNAGAPVDRSGESGLVVEVYPAAMLKIWKLTHQKYKTSKNASERASLVKEMESTLSWVRLGDFAGLCRDNDDALDAVLCAVMARLVRGGKARSVPDEHLTIAREEGWIALPQPLPDHS